MRTFLKRTSLRAPPSAERASTLIGIVTMIAGVNCASMQAGLSKYLTDDFPVVLIVWWRMFGTLAVVLPFALTRHRHLLLLPPRAGLQILRGVLLVIASISFVAATTVIPLTDAIAVAFVYPFLTTLLAPWVLGERVAPTTWIAVLGGFVGVLIVMRPTLDGIGPSYLLALLAGTAYSAVLILSRVLAGPSPTFVTATWTSATAVVLLSLALPGVWQTPDSWQLLLLATFGYIEIVSATVIGLFLFGDWPDTLTVIGLAVITASGLAVAFSSR